MSLRKDKFTWLFVIGIVLIVAAVAVIFLQAYARPHVSLRLGDGVFTADLAQTDGARERGLGGVSTLPKNRGMLFVFDSDDTYTIHMKNMRIGIDAIWLNSKKEVVHIVRGISPTTYPKRFTPDKPARYILEIPAGVAAERNIRLGHVAEFDLNETKGVQLW